MKGLRFVLVVLLGLYVFPISCSKESEEYSDLILGSWEAWKYQQFRNGVISDTILYGSEQTLPPSWSFRKDGTASFTMHTSQGEKVDRVNYRIIGDSIVYSFIDDNDTGEFIIEKLTKEELIYSYEYNIKSVVYKEVISFVKK